MNNRIRDLAKQAGYLPDSFGIGHWDMPECQKFGKLIAEQCASMCGSQADKKNIRLAFGLPVEDDVQYKGPDAHWSITFQYDRKYNLPAKES